MGRLFTRRLITLVKKLHHRIRLSREARADISRWKSFLPTWNGTAMFGDTTATAAADLEIYTDASGTHSCRAYYAGAWFHYNWPPSQRLSKQISIQIDSILAAAETWWKQKKILFYCDNLPIVQAREGKGCKQPRLTTLLRKLFLLAAKNNFTVTLKHRPGKTNDIADAHTMTGFSLSHHRHRRHPLQPESALNAQLQDLISLSVASSTRSTYGSGVRKFWQFHS